MFVAVADEWLLTKKKSLTPATRADVVRPIFHLIGNASDTVKHPVGTDESRPGGTISGPVLMTVADVALY
jgi:acyl-coenzyme A thioesterase PaaI-like protein